jgi:hypothetical protein
VGRPRKWSSPDELEQEIGYYFGQCEEKKVLPSKAGLYVSLDTTRETLREYEERPEYVEAIKRAYGQIESEWVGRLSAQGQAAGPIFYLKNAFSSNYRDKTETDITSKGEKLEGSADIAALAAKAAALLKEEKT